MRGVIFIKPHLFLEGGFELAFCRYLLYYYTELFPD